METPDSLNQSPGELDHQRKGAKAAPVSIRASEAPGFSSNLQRGHVNGHRRGLPWLPPHLVCMNCTALSHTLNCLPTFENWETMHHNPDFWFPLRIRKFGQMKLLGNIQLEVGVSALRRCASFSSWRAFPTVLPAVWCSHVVLASSARGIGVYNSFCPPSLFL